MLHFLGYLCLKRFDVHAEFETKERSFEHPPTSKMKGMIEIMV